MPHFKTLSDSSSTLQGPLDEAFQARRDGLLPWVLSEISALKKGQYCQNLGMSSRRV